MSSHFLFTYPERLSTDSHVASIEEMCRVADKVCVFPLLYYDGWPSRLLHPVISKLRTQRYRAVIQRVPYEFQKGGDRLLSIAREVR